MEEQLLALGLAAGARIAEELRVAERPLRWHELYSRLEEELGSRGTLTKSLTRLIDAGLVAKADGTYQLVHPERMAALLRAGADLSATVAADRAVAAKERARRLRKADFKKVPPVDAA